MSTFITGSSGFVGLALAEHLLAAGRDVVGYDLAPPPPAALEAFAGLPGRFAAVAADVRDGAALAEAMRRHRPRRLVAMAAITADARRERAAPQAIFDVNVGGVLAALSAAADVGVERAVHVSSGSAYGAGGRAAQPLREADAPLLPEGLYGMSKCAAEQAARRFCGLAGLPLAIGRLGTCFGPWEADSGVRDTPSAPLQALRLARRGREAVLPRAGLRDWLYVRDAAAAIAALLDAGRWSHPVYNLAAGHEWTVAQWCEALAARYPAFSWRMAAPGEAANVDYYADYDRASLDIARLRADTDFAPRYGLAESLADFLDWAARHGAGFLPAEDAHA